MLNKKANQILDQLNQLAEKARATSQSRQRSC